MDAFQELKITLGGKPGVGTTTIGKALAERLNVSFTSGGSIMRGFCSSLGLTEDKFKALRQSDPQWDRKLDDEQRRLGTVSGSLVLESRLGFHFIPHSFRVLVRCRETERISRLVNRALQGLEHPEAVDMAQLRREISQQERRRDTSDKRLFNQLYGIKNYLDAAQYAFVIDSSRHPVQECVELILSEAENFVRRAS